MLAPQPIYKPAEEVRFKVAHPRVCSAVEPDIALLKCRWRCLDASGVRMWYHITKVCRVIRACGVLHNVALNNARPFVPLTLWTLHAGNLLVTYRCRLCKN